jgi:hypothetical protein
MPEQDKDALMPRMAERPHNPELNAKQNAIIWALQLGNTRRAASGFAGVSPDTFYRWMSENRTFSDAVEIAESTAEVGYVAVLATAAQKGSVRAAIEWLKRRRRPEWGDKLDITKLDDETLLRLLGSEDEDADAAETEEGSGAPGPGPDEGDGSASSSDPHRGTEYPQQAGADYPASPE